MINTCHLTNPSPTDGNLRTGIDPLGMLREGAYDLNRFSFFHNTKSPHLVNRTANMVNSNCGNHHKKNFNLFNGGVSTFPVSPIPSGHHPIPLRTLLSEPLPKYDLMHSSLATQFNPMSVA